MRGTEDRGVLWLTGVFPLQKTSIGFGRRPAFLMIKVDRQRDREREGGSVGGRGLLESDVMEQL